MTKIRSNPSDRDETDQLDWLAFRFISDELSEEETAEFETRLADDQLARESVARAVELTELIAATAPAGCPVSMTATGAGTDAIADALTAAPRQVPGVSSTPSQAWYRPLAWMAVGAAACLAIVAAGQLLPVGEPLARNESPAPVAVEPGANAQAPELARLWSRSWDQFPADELAASGQPLAQVLPADEPGGDLLDPADAAQFESPSWMLAAVAGIAEGMVD